jgi:DNA-binding response OmpR family regulator
MDLTLARQESGAEAAAGQLEQRGLARSYLYDDGDLIVRPDAFVALARGGLMELPRRVLFLLFELARQPGVVRTRADLRSGAWGARARTIKPQSVDQTISRLRHALAEAIPEIEYVHTHPGLGYRFEREDRRDRDRFTSR